MNNCNSSNIRQRLINFSKILKDAESDSESKNDYLVFNARKKSILEILKKTIILFIILFFYVFIKSIHSIFMDISISNSNNLIISEINNNISVVDSYFFESNNKEFCYKKPNNKNHKNVFNITYINLLRLSNLLIFIIFLKIAKKYTKISKNVEFMNKIGKYLFLSINITILLFYIIYEKYNLIADIFTPIRDIYMSIILSIFFFVNYDLSFMFFSIYYLIIQYMFYTLSNNYNSLSYINNNLTLKVISNSEYNYSSDLVISCFVCLLIYYLKIEKQKGIKKVINEEGLIKKISKIVAYYTRIIDRADNYYFLALKSADDIYFCNNSLRIFFENLKIENNSSSTLNLSSINYDSINKLSNNKSSDLIENSNFNSFLNNKYQNVSKNNTPFFKTKELANQVNSIPINNYSSKEINNSEKKEDINSISNKINKEIQDDNISKKNFCNAAKILNLINDSVSNNVNKSKDLNYNNNISSFEKENKDTAPYDNNKNSSLLSYTMLNNPLFPKNIINNFNFNLNKENNSYNTNKHIEIKTSNIKHNNLSERVLPNNSSFSCVNHNNNKYKFSFTDSFSQMKRINNKKQTFLDVLNALLLGINKKNSSNISNCYNNIGSNFSDSLNCSYYNRSTIKNIKSSDKNIYNVNNSTTTAYNSSGSEAVFMVKNKLLHKDEYQINDYYFDVNVYESTIFSSQLLEVEIYNITKHKSAEIIIKNESISKQKFLAKLAHEFKTPLYGVISLIREIAEKSQNNNNIKDEISQIESLSNYTIFLVSDFIQGSKNSDFSIDLKEFKLYPLLEFSYNILKTLVIIYSKDRTIKTNLNFYSDYKKAKLNKNSKKNSENNLIITGLNKYNEEINSINYFKNLYVFSDEIRIKQVLLNCISNSVKFTKFGEININCYYNKEENSVYLEVTDTGTGMNTTLLSAVNGRDYDGVDKNRDMNFFGSGLGLSICHVISDKLDLKMEVNSELNKGTYIMFKLNKVEIKNNSTNTLSYNSHLASYNDSNKSNSKNKKNLNYSLKEDWANQYNEVVCSDKNIIVNKDYRNEPYKNFKPPKPKNSQFSFGKSKLLDANYKKVDSSKNSKSIRSSSFAYNRNSFKSKNFCNSNFVNLNHNVSSKDVNSNNKIIKKTNTLKTNCTNSLNNTNKILKIIKSKTQNIKKKIFEEKDYRLLTKNLDHNKLKQAANSDKCTKNLLKELFSLKSKKSITPKAKKSNIFNNYFINSPNLIIYPSKSSYVDNYFKLQSKSKINELNKSINKFLRKKKAKVKEKNNYKLNVVYSSINNNKDNNCLSKYISYSIPIKSKYKRLQQFKNVNIKDNKIYNSSKNIFEFNNNKVNFNNNYNNANKSISIDSKVTKVLYPKILNNNIYKNKYKYCGKNIDFNNSSFYYDSNSSAYDSNYSVYNERGKNKLNRSSILNNDDTIKLNFFDINFNSSFIRKINDSNKKCSISKLNDNFNYKIHPLTLNKFYKSSANINNLYLCNRSNIISNYKEICYDKISNDSHIFNSSNYNFLNNNIALHTRHELNRNYSSDIFQEEENNFNLLNLVTSSNKYINNNNDNKYVINNSIKQPYLKNKTLNDNNMSNKILNKEHISCKVYNLQIVITEDNKLLRNSLVNRVKKVFKLNNLDVEIILGLDGIDTIKYIIEDQSNGNKIKLVLTDESMSYVNGSQSLRFINSLKKESKLKELPMFVCITAYEDTESIDYLSNQGFNKVIDKNCKLEIIEEIIKDCYL